jgi:hypothetical protein
MIFAIGGGVAGLIVIGGLFYCRRSRGSAGPRLSGPKAMQSTSRAVNMSSPMPMQGRHAAKFNVGPPPTGVSNRIGAPPMRIGV